LNVCPAVMRNLLLITVERCHSSHSSPRFLRPASGSKLHLTSTSIFILVPSCFRQDGITQSNARYRTWINRARRRGVIVAAGEARRVENWTDEEASCRARRDEVRSGERSPKR